MLGIRKAGDAMKKLGTKALDFDEAYARRADKDLERLGPVAQTLGGKSLRSIGMSDLGDAKTMPEKMAAGLFIGAGTGANVGYRYGLPAAGVTLAGKALYDLTQSYQTPGTIEP